jgi:hypothetical protein
MKIDDPNQVNYFINQQNSINMGGEINPIISNVAPTSATVPKGSYIYAIKADGAANLVLSGISDPNADAYTLTGGNITILAGDVFYIPCSTFVIVSGKYIAYLRSKSL